VARYLGLASAPSWLELDAERNIVAAPEKVVGGSAAP
jgi:hypothetical protein